jgi:hypothetical protein
MKRLFKEKLKKIKMEYNAENMRLKKTPSSHLRAKFLKIDAIRLSVLKEFISKDRYFSALHRSITEKRTVING